MRTALFLIVLATLYRLVPTVDMSFANFSPVMAIGFCGAVYFRNRWMWLIPFAALSLSDLYINWFYAREYGFHWPVSGVIARTAARRAERQLITLPKQGRSVRPVLLQYLNRLSDLLWLMGREAEGS